MIEIAFEGIPPSADIEGLLKTSGQAVLQHLEVDAEVSILVSTDARLRKLNREHRGLDEPTDVLSFGNMDEKPEGQLRYLGDIAISLKRAAAQAAKGGHSLEAELQLLCVHGMLHLLGYEHGNADKKQAMWATQNEILDLLGTEMDRAQISS